MGIETKRGLNLLRSAIRRAGVPVYWHKNSPKTYTVHQHVILLVLRKKMGRGYKEFAREWAPWLRIDLIDLQRMPEQSTLCKEEQRLRQYMTDINIRLVSIILPLRPLAVGDGTGLAMRQASSYYIRKILGQRGLNRRGHAQAVFVGTTANVILGSGLRLKPQGELKVLRSIFPNLARKPSTLIWDKAGDSEKHHKHMAEQGVRSIAPVRRGWRRGKHRRQLATHFPQKTYNKRSHAETIIRLYKQRFGSSLHATSVKGRRAELATSTLVHNFIQRLKKALLSQLFNTTVFQLFSFSLNSCIE